MDLSIIIVNYNVQYFLENCLNSVFQATKKIDAEVIVVDNNSVDGSLKMLKEKFPQVQLVANKDNKGFSKANNQAIAIARGEFVLLLNPDTVVEENTFEVCLDFFRKNNKAGGLGVKMIDGKGNFLPESKRGLPTPSVAFYKIFGLSSLFPKSKRFAKYHLGFLSKDSNHQIEILSGAFMMIRKTILDDIGWLDESFFMYGEDIDLSYRITQAGHENHYTADTSIIHYKGESTKKSSINYVFVFYRAMIIFAKKHFSNKNARLFSNLINLAIYIRAALAVLTRTIRYLVLPAVDSILLYVGIYFFKEYYETKVKFTQGGSYPEEVESFGIPILIGIYLFGMFFNGAYNIPSRFKDIIRGIFGSSLLMLIVYSLLSEDLRFSRAIIVFTVLWSFSIIPLFRFLLDQLKLRSLSKDKNLRTAIIGKEAETNRINEFLKNTLNPPEEILFINSDDKLDSKDLSYSAQLYQLKDIIEIYRINEIIFCAKDLSSSEIIKQMALIRKEDVDFKIAPAESIYIIGSNSVESSGEYYILSSDSILKPISQKNKRVLDVIVSLLILVLSPLLFWFSAKKKNYYPNLLKILGGKLSFVSFITLPSTNDQQLRIKKGILNPADLLDIKNISNERAEQLNLEYGRKYTIWKDLEIITKNLNKIGK